MRTARIGAGRSATQLSHLQALAVYAEGRLAGRRVLVVGDATSGIPSQIEQLGARLVHVYDPVPARAEAFAARYADDPRRAKVVVARPLPTVDFEVRAGAFDVAFVPAIDELPDAGAWLARVRRVVADDGLAFVAARAEGDGVFRDLFDLVGLQFEEVRMFGTLPFRGVTFAELGDRDGGQISVDAQLAGDSAPHLYVAVGSKRPVRLETYAIIAVPPLAAAQETAASDALHAREAQILTLEARVKELLAGAPAHVPPILATVATEVSKVPLVDAATPTPSKDEEVLRVEPLQRRVVELERELASHRAALEAAGAEASALMEALEGERQARTREAVLVEDAQKAGATATAALAKAEEELGRRDQELDFLLQEMQSLGGAEGVDPTQVAAAIQAAESRASEFEARAAKAEGRLLAVREQLEERLSAFEVEAREQIALARKDADTRLAAKERENEALAQEVAVLRDALAAVAENVETAVASEFAALQAEIAKRDEAIRSLETALAERPAPGEGCDPLEDRLTAAQQELARYEGELQAQRWSIDELSLALARAKTFSRAPEPAGKSVSFQELEALRTALRLEHTARIAAESGATLAALREELARQAVLLDQCRSEAPDDPTTA
jgi:hypothetical protein